jgi:hypothetical protein
VCPPGSVTVFVAEQGARILQRVREVATGQEEDEIELAEYLKSLFEGRERISYYEAWRQLSRAPVFASIRYGGRTLANNVLLPEGPELVVLENPYNGGGLSPPNLTLVEHRRDDTDFALEAVALKHMPPLTDVELRAIELVPEDQLELNLGPHGDCCDNITDAVQIIIAVTFAMASVRPVDAYPERHLSAAEIERFGPAVSARQLLDIRRDLLGHRHM